MIRRRHVFYVAGNDPRGVASYYGLFRRELARFQKVSSVETTITEPENDPKEPVAVWSITARKDHWQVATTYEFLRWDDIISANMARSMWLRYPLVLSCFFKNLFNGMIARVFWASWQYGLVYIYPPIALVLMLAIPIVLGWWVASLSSSVAGLAAPWTIIAGCLAGIAIYALALKAADRYFVIQLAEARLWADDWAYARRPDYIARADAFARRIIARARAGDVDEILIIGHSGGGAVALLVTARALEIDPNFARSVPNVALATLGSLLPLAALHPAADQARDAIRRVAIEPSVTWVDCQARQDAMNFYRFDPVEGVGLNIESGRCNPMIWKISMKAIVSPRQYKRLRWNFFRMHFQFIMANDVPAHYDYFMIVCGPTALADQARPACIAAPDLAPDAPARSDSPMQPAQQR